MNRRAAHFLAGLLLIAGTAACGSDDGGDQPGTPAPLPGTGVPIRGTERLAWDQAAASYQVVLQYSFALYVDGSRTMLSGTECLNSAGASGYPCSARLPPISDGTHVLELAAIAGGSESGRSSPLTVNVNQGRMVIEGAGALDNPSRMQAGLLCVAPATCFTVTPLATSTAPLSSPAPTPDGRLLFIEDGRHVRVLDEGVVASEPAFSVTAPGARVVALLVDPAFDRTPFVRLAWIEATARGSSLVIARLRETNNRLFDPAVIVPGIPLSGSSDPLVAQDDLGTIYVAMPGDAESMRPGQDVYASSILRFDPNGLTWSAGLGGAVIARAYERPQALTIDSRTRLLWLAGIGRGRREGVISMALGERGAAASSLAVAHATGVEGIVSLVPLRQGNVADLLALDASGQLLYAAADPSALTIRSGAELESGEPMSLHAGMMGELYAAVRSTSSLVQSFSILRLDPSREP